MATLARPTDVLNGLALPTVLVVVAVIFAGVVALDHRRQRAAARADEAQ